MEEKKEGKFKAISTSKREPIVVGISGASGIFYAIELLSMLREVDIFKRIYLVITSSARRVFLEEVSKSKYQYPDFIDDIFLKRRVHDDIEELSNRDIGAVISSGSHPTSGMVILPASANTLSSIALGISNNLLTRSALVTLKERRRFVIVLREAPYTESLLMNMLQITRDGGVVLSAAPGFYIEDNTTLKSVIRSFTNKLLYLLGITVKIEEYEKLRWKSQREEL